MKRWGWIVTVCLLSLWACSPMAESRPEQIDHFKERYGIRYQGLVADEAMVVSAMAYASRVGVQVMQQGGNAVDAAVAVHFALAVVYPVAGNLGGGGFAVYRTSEGAVHTLDFRETAPEQSTRDMYLNANGKAEPGWSRNGALAVGVPGSVDGMVRLHERFGTQDWASLLAPAITMAEDGFPITALQAERLRDVQDDLLTYNTHDRIPLLGIGWHSGDTLRQPDLARTLRSIQQYKRAGFYEGENLQRLIRSVQAAGGLLTPNDLRSYQSVWREPIQFDYGAYRFYSMGLPSSGGILLAQMLYHLSHFPLAGMGWNTDRYLHLLTEVERLAYADRAKYLGDPDFVAVPVDTLLSAAYLDERLTLIDTQRATPSEAIEAGTIEWQESEETTHFSIVDPAGNAIAITTTLNSRYGSKVMVEGGGYFLNNEMDDFSIQPGVPNQFGLIGGEANAIAPGKRMLSSMTPTIIEKEGDLYMVVGSPGGSKIITSVLQAFLNVTAHGLSLQEAVNAGRVHHQWQPDILYFEDTALDSLTMAQLTARGHTLRERSPYGAVDAIRILPNGQLEGGADFRGDDAAMGW